MTAQIPRSSSGIKTGGGPMRRIPKSGLVRFQGGRSVRSMKAASRERSKAFSFEAMNEGLRAALRAVSSGHA